MSASAPLPEARLVASPAAMHALAQAVARDLTGGSLVLLTGELGAGKTTFVQGLAAALGVTTPPTSPTFTIVSEYPVTNHPVITQLIHVDLYRLELTTAQTDANLAEVLDRAPEPARLTVIEWADRLGEKIKNMSARRLLLRHGATPNERQVTIT